MSEQDNARLVRDTYQAFNERDFDRAAAGYAPDSRVLSHGLGGLTFDGPDGFLAYLGAWAGAFPDAVTVIHSLVAAGDRVVVEFSGRGTHTGPLVGPGVEAPPTGRTVDIPFCDVFELRDGKITGQHNYFDMTTLMRQLGLLG